MRSLQHHYIEPASRLRKTGFLVALIAVLGFAYVAAILIFSPGQSSTAKSDSAQNMSMRELIVTKESTGSDSRNNTASGQTAQEASVENAQPNKDSNKSKSATKVLKPANTSEASAPSVNSSLTNEPRSNTEDTTTPTPTQEPEQQSLLDNSIIKINKNSIKLLGLEIK